MTIIFKAKTQEGYTIKILSELLQNIIDIACFRIDENGIFLRMSDTHRCILTDIELKKDNFNIYEMTSEKIFIGLNLTHLYKMLKSVKKKDALVLYIDDEFPEELSLVVYPKENNRVSTRKVRIQNTQNITVPFPVGYSNPILVPSNEYQRTIKDMNVISKTLHFNLRKYSLDMSCVDDGIYSRQELFGELDDTTLTHYEDDFDMEHFIRIIKVSGLSKTLQVFGSTNLPLCIRSDIGGLGVLSIFIKSQQMIRQDNQKR